MNKRLILLAKYLEKISFKKESFSVMLLIKEAASKLNSLKKLKFSEQTAKEIDDICKGFSMWMAYRLISHVINSNFGPINNQEAVQFLNDNFRRFKQDVSYIMDWVKVGLNGEYAPFKETSFDELLTLAEEWHNSLEVGDGVINYKEENEIILDFREPDGTGYYWVDLKTSRCDEESERMGHCGTTSSRNTLYSLRRYIPIGRGFTLNKSVITAAITPDGKIAQMKGPKNSKPLQDYHKYIIPLLNLKKVDEEGVESMAITGYRLEYSGDDFSLKDLTNEQLIDLMKTNPNLFNSPAGKILVAIKLNDKSLATDVIGEFIPSVYLLSEIISTPRNSLSLERIFDIINDPVDLYDWYIVTKEDLKYLIKDINDANKDKIIENYKKEFGDMEINKDNFKEKIKENFEEFLGTDVAISIITAIRDTMSDTYYKKIKDKTLSVLNNFGEARVYDGNILLKINIYNFIKSLSSYDQDKALEILQELDGLDISKVDDLAENFFERVVEEGLVSKEQLFIDLDNVFLNIYDFNINLSSLL